MKRYLFNPEKLRYVTGDRPQVECILCEMAAGTADISSLVLHTSKFNLVTLNLYPYNPGHLMIAPLRHIESILDLNADEAADAHQLIQFSIKILDLELKPHGYNIGYNMGQESGASIKHLHQHVVPRYKNEVGFVDVLANSRIVVVDPHELHTKLCEAFAQLS